MSDDQTVAQGLKGEQLIKSGLDDQVNAITGYENIIWKVRAGYVLVLNGALALVIGRNGEVLNLCSQAHNAHLKLIPLFLFINFAGEGC